MTNKRKSFLLHIDSLDILDDLDNEQVGLLFRAIKSYQLGEEIKLDPMVKIAFSPFKNQFARDAEKYENTCKARDEAGSRGGKQKVANASKPKQKVANLADSVSDSKNKSDSKSDSDSDLLKDPLSAETDHDLKIKDVISHFNKVTSSKVSHKTESHRENISARLKDGYPVEDLNLVIDFKFKEWGSDPKMASYVRPQTLFIPKNFNGYLLAAKATPIQKSSLHDLSGIKYESGDL